MDILTKRPDGMSFEEYKVARNLQKIFIKKKKKGSLVWLSKLHPSEVVIKELTDAKLLASMGRLLTKGGGETFRGKVEDLRR